MTAIIAGLCVASLLLIESIYQKLYPTQETAISEPVEIAETKTETAKRGREIDLPIEENTAMSISDVLDSQQVCEVKPQLLTFTAKMYDFTQCYADIDGPEVDIILFRNVLPDEQREIDVYPEHDGESIRSTIEQCITVELNQAFGDYVARHQPLDLRGYFLVSGSLDFEGKLSIEDAIWWKRGHMPVYGRTKWKVVDPEFHPYGLKPRCW